VDEPTVAIYERNAREWARRRSAPADDWGLRLRRRVGPGLVLDAGCGAGRYFVQLGAPTIALDATAGLLAIARGRMAGAVDGQSRPAAVQGDLEALPFGDATFDGVFAHHSYLHLPRERAPGAFAEAARVLVAGGSFLVSMIAGTYTGRALPGDDFPGRWFSLWTPETLDRALCAAGFCDVDLEVTEGHHRDPDVVATATRP
jgi:SAM-dependent methyltransferase